MVVKKIKTIPATPLIPDEVYEALPPFLKELCSHFIIKRERDIFFTAFMGVVSGMLSGISGLYKNIVLFPMIYSVICAPPASGKGVLVFARLLAEAYHDFLKAQNAEKNNHEDKSKIPLVAFIIPADSSAAMFLQLLKNNGGIGILFETEVDSLVNSLKKEWGTYDDKLRGGFHHETISYSRKGEGIIIEIKKPKISMVLAGTPGQVKKLLPSTENGLFSRIAFYVFTQEAKWDNANSCPDCENPEDVFRKKGELLMKYVLHLEAYPVKFELTESQWNNLNAVFSENMQNHVLSHGDDARSVVARMGVIVFRISMIFTAIRNFGNTEVVEKLTCSDTDFNNALTLGQIYLEHSKAMMEVTPDSTVAEANERIEFLYRALPIRFSRFEAVRIGNTSHYSARTVDRYLNFFVRNSMLTQPQYGYYEKKVIN